MFLIFSFLFFLKMQLRQFKKNLCLYYWIGILSQSNVSTKINDRDE